MVSVLFYAHLCMKSSFGISNFLEEISREGTELHPSAENWIKDLLSWPRPPEQDPVFPIPTASPSHQEVSISLLSSSMGRQIELKSQSHKTEQTDHMDHSLV